MKAVTTTNTIFINISIAVFIQAPRISLLHIFMVLLFIQTILSQFCINTLQFYQHVSQTYEKVIKVILSLIKAMITATCPPNKGNQTNHKEKRFCLYPKTRKRQKDFSYLNRCAFMNCIVRSVT